MNKLKQIKYWIFIIAVLIIIAILVILVIDNVFAVNIITLQNGQCIRNSTNSTICSIQFVCPKVNQNISIVCPAQICQYNLSCPSPIIQNRVNNNFTNIEQPIVSRTFFKDNQIPIFALLGGVIILIVWKNGWFSKLKLGDSYKHSNYPTEQTRGIERDIKDNLDEFK